MPSLNISVVHNSQRTRYSMGRNIIEMYCFGFASLIIWDYIYMWYGNYVYFNILQQKKKKTLLKYLMIFLLRTHSRPNLKPCKFQYNISVNWKVSKLVTKSTFFFFLNLEESKLNDFSRFLHLGYLIIFIDSLYPISLFQYLYLPFLPSRKRKCQTQSNIYSQEEDKILFMKTISCVKSTITLY